MERDFFFNQNITVTTLGTKRKTTQKQRKIKHANGNGKILYYPKIASILSCPENQHTENVKSTPKKRNIDKTDKINGKKEIKQTQFGAGTCALEGNIR